MLRVASFLLGFLALLLWGGAISAAGDKGPDPPEKGPLPAVKQENQGPQVQLPNTTGPIITDLAITQTHKTWTLQITPTFYLTGGVFNGRWQPRAAGTKQPNHIREIGSPGDYRSLQVPVQLFYGLTPRMDVSVASSFNQNWAFNVSPHSQSANFGSLGDTSVQLRYMFLNGGPTETTVTGYFSLQFPTGHASPLAPKFLGIDQTGAGAFAFTWGVNVFKYLPKGPVLLYANFWYTNNADGRVNRTRVNYPDQVTMNLALEVPLKKSPDNRWAFLLEMLSSWDAGRMFGPRANQAPLAIVSLLPAVEFLPCKWFTLAAGVQVPIIGKNTTFNYAPTLALYVNF